MTWYYVPYTCAPDTAASSLPSEASPAPWLTLSGTPTQRPLSWRGWRNRGWIGLLSGLTCAPSTLARGVAEWISSLPVFPASPSVQRASGPELTMTVGSGRRSPGFSVTFDPATASWRTSQELFATDYPMSSLTLPRSGSMRSGVCSPRPPLVPLTSGNGSGSWPTPTGMDSRSSGGNPNTTGTHGVTLTDRAVRTWPTPKARDAKGEGFAGDLPNQAKMWPRASEGFRGTDPPHGTGGPSLRQVATGTASHHAPTTPPDGPNGSQTAVLNPRFVEPLLGLPEGWSLATPFGSQTACTCSETAWCRKLHDQLGTNSPHDWSSE